MFRFIVLALVASLYAFSASANPFSDCTEIQSPDLAIAACSEIIQTDAAAAAFAYEHRAVVYFGRKDFDRAITDFSKLLELDPGRAQNYYFRGMAYRDKSELDRALSDLNRVIELQPKWDNYYNTRGRILISMGKYDEAQIDFDIP